MGTTSEGTTGGTTTIDTTSRVAVYVDGFNLYYRALKRTSHKWLNLDALCRALLHKTPNIVEINYYTARVKQLDPSFTDQVDQEEYLRALKTLPHLKIHYGNFQVTDKFMRLKSPIVMKPDCSPRLCWQSFEMLPEVVQVIKTEEKGSDVNFGAHLVRDAFQNKFDIAAVITNDTDLVEPLRIVKDEVGKKVILLSPVGNPAGSLKRVVNGSLFINPSYLARSQFPNPHSDINGGRTSSRVTSRHLGGGKGLSLDFRLSKQSDRV